MKKTLLILSLLLITTNAYAEWTLYTSNVKGNDHFYDKSTIKRNGDKVKVWSYWNLLPDDEKAKSFNTYSARILEEFDCVNETTKVLKLDSFTKNNLEGDIRDVTPTNPTIRYIVPNSTNAILMKLVCKK